MRIRALAPLITCLVLICSIITPRLATGTHAAAAHIDARSVVRTFMADLHAADKTGDFSQLATMYAPDATLTFSFHDGTSGVARGAAKVVAFYKGGRTPGKTLWLDSITLLSPNVVYVYEHFGSPGQKSPSLCTHAYVIVDGKITTEEFVEYYPGKGM